MVPADDIDAVVFDMDPDPFDLQPALDRWRLPDVSALADHPS